MYNARRATGWLSVFYFVSLIILGMMIVMSLFLAILLSNFTVDDDDIDSAGAAKDTDDLILGGVDHTERSVDPERVSAISNRAATGDAESKVEDASRSGRGDRGGARSGLAPTLGHPTVPPPPSFSRRAPSSTAYGTALGDGSREGGSGTKSDPSIRDEVSEGVTSSGKDDGGIVARVRGACKRGKEYLLEYYASSIRTVQVPDDIDPGRALFVLGPNNPVRRGCSAVVSNLGFERVTLLLIATSSIMLALNSPLRDPDSAIESSLDRAEVVLAVLFCIEMAFKVLANGFLFMPGAYLRSSWNALDFLVVVVSIIDVSVSRSGGLAGLRSLRALRALRPLR